MAAAAEGRVEGVSEGSRVVGAFVGDVLGSTEGRNDGVVVGGLVGGFVGEFVGDAIGVTKKGSTVGVTAVAFVGTGVPGVKVGKFVPLGRIAGDGCARMEGAEVSLLAVGTFKRSYYKSIQVRLGVEKIRQESKRERRVLLPICLPE